MQANTVCLRRSHIEEESLRYAAAGYDGFNRGGAFVRLTNSPSKRHFTLKPLLCPKTFVVFVIVIVIHFLWFVYIFLRRFGIFIGCIILRKIDNAFVFSLCILKSLHSTTEIPANIGNNQV